jgi:choline dehydrogenase-like flavoprotein
MTTETFDYVIVGAGAAGSVLAARLSEDPSVRVALIEAGPSDENEPRALQLARWFEMLEGEYDRDYRSVEQERGNSDIRQSRARILGGCTSHNTMIAFKTPREDLDSWVAAGAQGWDADTLHPYFDRLLTPIQPVIPEHRNPFLADVTRSAQIALDLPPVDDWNEGELRTAAGFFPVAYDPQTGVRGSSSVWYLHPVMHTRDNLTLFLETSALTVDFDGRRAVGVTVESSDGRRTQIRAEHEVIVACGAIDTPALLIRSGVGRAADVDALGLTSVVDLPGVGENLMDHPEGLIIWESNQPITDPRVSDWDAGILARADGQQGFPDLMFHLPLMTFGVHAETHGYVLPENTVSITPNVPRPRSRGRVWLESADPSVPPKIDYRYFTDPEGYDEAMLMKGLEYARRIAATEPMRSWIVREVFPGPDVDGEELRELVRRTNHTVYHVSGTCRMGAADDAMAVVDPQLRVRGVDGLRIVDASVFPVLTTINPMVTLYMMGERAADLIRETRISS